MYKMANLRGILFLVSAASLGLVHCCDEDQIQQCNEAFIASVGEGLLTTEEQITTACTSAYPALQSCIAPFKSGCSASVRAIFEGTDALYDYVCDEGKADAVTHNPCMARSTVQGAITSCDNNLTIRLQGNPFASRATKCRYIEDYFDCVKEAVDSECGSAAAEYGDKTNRLTFKPLLEIVGCETDETDNEMSEEKDEADNEMSEEKDEADNEMSEENNEEEGNGSAKKGPQNDGPAIAAMMWLVGGALILQWLIR